MAISFTREYEQLIIFDFKSDKTNLESVYKLIKEVHQDLIKVHEFILSKFERIENFDSILDKLQFVENEKIRLQDYLKTREIQDLLDQIKSQNVNKNEIFCKRENLLVFYEKISPCRFIDLQLLRLLKNEGYDCIAKILREIQHMATKPILRYLLELYDVYCDLFELKSDLEFKKEKLEQKLTTGLHKNLLHEIRQSKQNYSRDTILLIEGLLKTDGFYFHSLKRQLDDHYNKIIQPKLLELNKLVNFQEKDFIDEKKVKEIVKSCRKQYLRLQRYILQ